MAQAGPISYPCPSVVLAEPRLPNSHSSLTRGWPRVALDLRGPFLQGTIENTQTDRAGTSWNLLNGLKTLDACLLITCPCVSRGGLGGPQGAAKPLLLAATELTKKNPGKCVRNIGSGPLPPEVWLLCFPLLQAAVHFQTSFHIHQMVITRPTTSKSSCGRSVR